MHVVRTQFEVTSFDEWKRVFDEDPAGREEAGARRYRVLRDSDAGDRVMVDLEFDDAERARAFLASLREVWARGGPIRDADGRVAEVVETREY